MAEPVDLTQQIARISELTEAELRNLQTQLSTRFTEADEADDLDSMASIADHFDAIKARLTVVTEKAPDAPEARTEPVKPVAETPAAPVVEKPAEPVAEAPAEVVTPEPIPAPEATTETPPAPVTEIPVATTTVTEPAPQEGLPVAASATTTIAVPEENAPVLASAPASRVYAGADIPGTTAGHEFGNINEFGEALARRLTTLSSLRGGDGEQVVIASIKTDAPSDRTLDMGDPLGNMEKIHAVTDEDALGQFAGEGAITAAGGCCAPLVTKYSLWDNGGVTDRPVRDALAGFRAERGGIRFYGSPVLADLQGALGFWTCADDAAADAANTSTWKVCGRINCPPEQTAELQAITMCLTFGVLQTRIFPELAVANNKLALVAQARLADSALLAQIKAGSTAVTDGGTAWGAVRDLMNALGRATMYFRDRYRIRSAPLRAIMPSWVLEALRTDLLDGPDWGRDWGKHYGVSEDEIRSFFAARNINVTFALDSAVPATNGGGFFNAISGAALPAFPTTVEWALYPEGSWLFLDGGQLDLGIIRDSALVRTNDYMQFSETFEAAAKIGGESLWITSTIDVSGKYPAAV